MKHTLTLNNEQAQALFILMSNRPLNGTRNRIRWKFLAVIEDAVIAYEGKINEIRKELKIDDKGGGLDEALNSTALRELSDMVKDLAKTKADYDFSDREVFAQAKDIFTKIGEDEDPGLNGRMGKLYYEIEDAFLNVVVEKDA